MYNLNNFNSSSIFFHNQSLRKLKQTYKRFFNLSFFSHKKNKKMYKTPDILYQAEAKRD